MEYEEKVKIKEDSHDNTVQDRELHHQQNVKKRFFFWMEIFNFKSFRNTTKKKGFGTILSCVKLC